MYQITIEEGKIFRWVLLKTLRIARVLNEFEISPLKCFIYLKNRQKGKRSGAEPATVGNFGLGDEGTVGILLFITFSYESDHNWTWFLINDFDYR